MTESAGRAEDMGGVGSAVPPTDADRLARLDAQIGALQHEIERARWSLLRTRDALAAALAERAVLVALIAPPAPSASTPGPVSAPSVAMPPQLGALPGAPARPETSTRTVQNVLFVLGGVLLGTAAIAFTVVAWTRYGVIARAAILATVTVLALAVPAVALARRLRATAETFAAIGLLLVVLDGYAVWSVDLGGVQSLDGRRYAGIVAAAAAAFAVGYGRLTRLAGPAFAALVAAQPVVLLVAAPAGLEPAVTSLLAATVAAADALVLAMVRRSGPTRPGPVHARALQVVASVAFAVWVAAAAIAALVAEATTATVAGRVLAGTAMVMVSLVLLLGAWAAGPRTLRAIAAGGVVAALVLAVFRTAMLAWPGHRALVFAATTLAVGGAARLAVAAVPWLGRGPRWAASGVAGLGLGALAAVTVEAAAITVGNAWPLWTTPLAATGPNPPLLTWELAVALLGLTLAVGLTGPRWTHAPSAIGGSVLTVLALPACTSLSWWAPPVLDLAGTALLATAYLIVRRRARRGSPAGGHQPLPHLQASTLCGAAVLMVDAVLTSAARPGLTALSLTGILGLGLAVAAAARRASATVAAGSDQVVGASALATGLIALAPAVGSGLRALDLQPWWALRATVGTSALLLLALVVVRHLTTGRSTVDPYVAGTFVSAVGSATVWPLTAVWVGDEPVGIYSGLSLVLLAGALLVLPPLPAARPESLPAIDRTVGWPVGAVAVAAAPNAVVFALAVLPAVLAVTAYPYTWLSSVWSGPPQGVGLAPAGVDPLAVHAVDAAALGLLAVAGAVAAYAVARRPGAALAGLGVGGPTAVLATVVVLGAPWPTLPAVTMIAGFALVLPAALARTAPRRTTVLIGQGVVYIGGGVAGTLGVRWATLATLAAVVVAFCVVGAVGRTVAWRVAGCLVAVASAVAEASAAGLAAELSLRRLALGVLGVAVLALFAGALLRRDATRRAPALATEAAAVGAAVVALAFTAGHRGWAAAVCAVWGLALATRALVPGITPGVRAAYAAAGGGLEVVAWWLLLAARGETLLEAYTLPLATVALFAGWAALRSRPDLRSWVAYGPALLAGFLPTLATVIVAEGQPWRRLTLGAAALLCVVAGAIRLRRAPVVVGGTVLVLVALHELVLLWEVIEGWIPLAVGGAVLLFLAITYERRRRDLGRIRSALHRMT